MTDQEKREKVAKGLEYHLKELSLGKKCFECPYWGDNPCEIQLISDALNLLKTQEPEKVLSMEHDQLFPGHYDLMGDCPGCHKHIEQLTNQHYCGYCGKGLIWK